MGAWRLHGAVMNGVHGPEPMPACHPSPVQCVRGAICNCQHLNVPHDELLNLFMCAVHIMHQLKTQSVPIAKTLNHSAVQPGCVRVAMPRSTQRCSL